MKFLRHTYITFFSILLITIAATAQQDSIVVSGTLKNLDGHKVIISFKDEQGASKSFNAVANNDAFSMKVPAQTMPVNARLDVGINRTMTFKQGEQTFANPAPALDLFVFNKDIKIKGDALLVQFAAISGDEENNYLESYNKSVRDNEIKSYENYKSLLQAHYNQATLTRPEKEIQEENRLLNQHTQQKKKEFIVKNPGALASLFFLGRLASYYTADDYAAAFNNLSDKYKEHPLAIPVKKAIQQTRATAAGTAAKLFERKDKDGNIVRLQDYKGKTVLVDFWGSWCGPCRASHPHLKELYKKYKADGFEIIAIAQERGKTIEESREAWLKAIEKDGINWVHILNADGIEKQDIVKDYAVNSFPTKILVDKEGKVLLRISASATDDIDKALEKIYGH